jgi:hypothetical protein
MIKADIMFGDGSVHRCVGRVVNRESVPFVDEADVRRHIARVNQKQGADVLHFVRIVKERI